MDYELRKAFSEKAFRLYQQRYPASQMILCQDRGRIYCGSEYLCQLRWKGADWDIDPNTAYFDRKQ